MNHVSIFEKKWLDLVFEGKNKSYGAYQLRRENPRTTLLALLFGLLLLASVVSVGLLAARLTKKVPAITEVFEEGPTVTPVDLSQKPPPPTQSAATPPVFNDDEIPENTQQLRDPEIVSAAAAPDIHLTSDPVAPETPPGNNGIHGENPTAATAASAGTTGGEGKAPSLPETPVPPATLDKMPIYPGGMNAFYEYVGDHFNRPEIDDVKTATVIVMFVIEKDGSITDVRVARDPGYGMAKEAMRVLKSMKEKWTPGMKNGQPVRTAYTLPITVNIN